MNTISKILFTGAILASNVFAEDISIMTLNIRRDGPEQKEERKWTHRAPLIEQLLQSKKPDIFGLQEVTQNQWADLNNMLPDYESFGKGRGTSWFGWGPDEATPLFYNKNKFELLAQGTFMINKNPFLAILNLKTNGVLPRVCTWGCFKTKETGKSFYVVNTHLDHKYDQARINQLQTIITTMNTYLKDNEAPVFFMGDFNTPMSESMQQVIPMFENSKAIACQVTGPEVTAISWGHGQEQSIDHILVKNNNKIAVSSHEVIVGQELSDHRPVMVQAEIK